MSLDVPPDPGTSCKHTACYRVGPKSSSRRQKTNREGNTLTCYVRKSVSLRTLYVDQKRKSARLFQSDKQRICALWCLKKKRET